MSTTTLLVLLLLASIGLLVVAVPAYLVWRHPRLGMPVTVAVAVAAVFVTLVFGIAALPN
ncbi:hypothetical protein ACFU3J_16225 [Streptomyces sp. NPDC057411]|uniref:hypothetical protein n=1 Tax=unclassified Streptomyces TaxID=2593676 RepID=UPI00363220AE